MNLTFAHIHLNLLIPLLISFDGSTASISPYTFQMHPNGYDKNIQIADDWAIDDKNCLKLYTWDVDKCWKDSDAENVNNLLESDFLAKIDFANLKETDPKC